MTTYPGRQADQFAAKIKDMDRRLKVAETQLNTAKTTIANHVYTIGKLTGQFTAAQVTFIAGLTTAQMAFISGLSSAQATFLSNVEQIGVPVNYPLSDDPFNGAGPNWQTGERLYINDAIDLVNDLVGKMRTQHIMS